MYVSPRDGPLVPYARRSGRPFIISFLCVLETDSSFGLRREFWVVHIIGIILYTLNWHPGFYIPTKYYKTFRFVFLPLSVLSSYICKGFPRDNGHKSVYWSTLLPLSVQGAHRDSFCGGNERSIVGHFESFSVSRSKTIKENTGTFVSFWPASHFLRDLTSDLPSSRISFSSFTGTITHVDATKRPNTNVIEE